MSLAQWRQFNFFDKQQTTDPIQKGKTPDIFQVIVYLLRACCSYSHLEHIEYRSKTSQYLQQDADILF